jgi:hypothetical protein
VADKKKAEAAAQKKNGTDPYGGLTGADRDAAVAITALFRSYGLDSLAPTIVKYIQNGYSADTITILLRETPAYKKRFSANEAREKAGLPVLSPAEYLAVEGSYRQIMSSAGLPPGFYDQPSDFTKFISGDMSPKELQDRVTLANEAYYKADEGTRAVFAQWYTKGDIVAYMLDPKRASEVDQEHLRAAQAASAGKASGVALTQAQAEDIGSLGLSADQQAQGLQQAGESVRNVGKLGEIYGETYTASDAVAEVFKSSGKAAEKRRGLASRERGTFGGSANTSATALSNRKSGQV